LTILRLLAGTCFLAFAAPAITFAADLAADEHAAICGARQSCEIVAVTAAGTGGDGTALRVAEVILGLGDQADDLPEAGCRSTEAALGGGELDGCREFWLLAGSAAPRQVLALCNDGYGAAGVGEDVVEITANRITHRQYGGSAWRWDVTKKIRLSPMMVVEEASCSYHNVAPGIAALTIVDRTRFEARAYGWVTEGVAPDDISMGCPDVTADFTKALEQQPTPDVLAGYAVPAPFAADASPLPDGTTLGTCGLALTSDGARGFLVHGKAADGPDAAEMRVIAETASSLLIQIRDPLAAEARKAAQGLSWIKEPHVEIWTAREGEFFEGDPSIPEKQYDQIGINLDGSVHVGVGKPEKLPLVTGWPARDEQGRDVTVLRVTWEDEYGLLNGLGVVYSQAQDGKQMRLVSNAPIKKNKPLFLPQIWSNYPEEGDVPNGGCEYSGESRQLDL
jgi:hypothetical protein